MTPSEKWALIKSYNPERTIIQEYDQVAKKLLDKMKEYMDRSGNWDFIAVQRWQEEVKALTEYKKYLKANAKP